LVLISDLEVDMRVSGIARRLQMDNNPLRRLTDRVETWLTAVVLVASVGLGPVLAWRAAAEVHHATTAAATQDQTERFPVTAVLQEDTKHSAYDDGVQQRQQAPAPARWTAPDGTPRTGLVVPTAAASAGTSILIETDAHGTPLPPAVGQDASTNAVLAALMVMVGVAAAATFLILLLRRYLDRIRMSRWRRDWLLFEPIWSGRR
jgi:hypothetical protein